MIEKRSVDSVVIGTGVAGFAAAVRLHLRGKRVVVLEKNPGATVLSSGAWDFGRVPREMSTFDSLFGTSAWKECQQGVLTEDGAIAGALPVFEKEILPRLRAKLPLYFATEKPLVLPTTHGKWKACFLAQTSQAKSDLHGFSGKKVGLVSHPSWRFRGPDLAKQLQESAKARGVDLHCEAIELPMKYGGNDVPLSRVAADLFHRAEFRAQFSDALKAIYEKTKAPLILPPVFLDYGHFESLAKLLPVSECLATQEPVPGYRLQRAMEGILEDLGIERVSAGQVEPVPGDTSVASVIVHNYGKPAHEIAAKNYVLASGKFLSGGLHIGYETLEEPCFGFPLFTERSRDPIGFRNQIDWTTRSFSEPQAWMKLGVWTDSKWRPSASKRAVYRNVYACGSILGGLDFAYHGFGLGYFALTGLRCADAVE